MTTEKKGVPVILGNVKISYPNLFRKENNPKFPKPEDKRTYGCKFLLHKTKHAEKIAEITIRHILRAYYQSGFSY